MFDPEGLCIYDPILQPLWRISRGKMWVSVLFAVAVNGFFCLCIGALIASLSPSHQTLSPLQPQTFPIEIFIYVITIPTIWIYYLREPQRIVNIFIGLAQNDVVAQNEAQPYSTIEEFLNAQRHIFNKKSYTILSLVFTLINFLLWASTVFTPNNPFWFQHSHTWWEINPWYFWLIWTPLVWGSVYMVWYTFIRRVITVLIITRFTKAFTLTPKLFHTDRANGLSPIGNYPIGFTVFLLVAGLWIFLGIAYPLFFGQSINLKYDTIIYILLYIILISIALIVPTWKTHIIMLKSKQQALETVAVEIRRLLIQSIPESPSTTVIVNTSKKEPKDLIENIEALERQYRLLEREYHTWPFNLTSLSQFLLGTLLPLFSSVISILLSFTGK